MTEDRLSSIGNGQERSVFLYLSKLVHEGYYNTRITWGEFRNVFSPIFGRDSVAICKELEEEGYIESYEEDAPFMLLRKPSVSLEGDVERKVMVEFFKIMADVPLAYNTAVNAYLQKSLIMAIIGSFYDQELTFSSTPEERVIISAVTSDTFLQNGTASELMDKEIAGAEERDMDLSPYLEMPWFNELLLIIKNGYYGNGSFNFIDTLESSFRNEFTDGILEILRNGSLLWLILNFRTFMKRENVDRALKEFMRKSREGRKLSKFYDWLSIGNDFAIGVEFLIGSIEFFPGYNSTVGIYLFILGSLQLFSRPVITTFKKLHQKKLDSRRIRF